MPRNSYLINTDDLYKTWHKQYRPLFDYLEMDGGLSRAKNDTKKYKELKLQIINESLKERIDEIFMKDLKKQADRARKGRSKFIRVFYQGVMKTKGWIHFQTSSQYTKGKRYYQYIRLDDIKDIKHLKGYKKRDIMRLLLSGNISCHCSCLKGDTLIKLLDGRTISIKDMEKEYKEGKDLWVYSTDSKGDFKAGKVEKVWITKKTKKFIKVTLDNGRDIYTTEDHPYMLRDGTYLRADLLKIDQSLMPMYFNYTNGYENVKFNSDGVFRSVYKTVAHDVYSESDIQEVLDSCGDSRYAIHHKDFNKLNNTPMNLKLMGFNEHYQWHSKHLSDRWKEDPIFVEKSRTVASRNAKKRNANPTKAMIKSRKGNLKKGHDYWRTPEGRAIKSSQMSKHIKDFWANLSDKERLEYLAKHPSKTIEGRKLRSKNMKAYWDNLGDDIKKVRGELQGLAMRSSLRAKLDTMSNEERIAYDNDFCNKVREGKKRMCKVVLDYLIENAIPLTESNYIKYKGKTYPKVSTHFDSFDDMLAYFNISTANNHKIVNIEVIELDEEEPVYDIKVAKWENFLVDSGVVLHNCPDFLYKGFKYMGHKQKYGIFKENRPPNIRNPRREGTVCKHLLAVFDVFMVHWTSISKDMFKSYYWKKRYDED